MKRSLANLAKCGINHLAALAKTRNGRMQRRADLAAGFIATIGLDVTP